MIDLEKLIYEKVDCPACGGDGAFYSTDPFNISRDTVTSCSLCNGTKKIIRILDFPRVPRRWEVYAGFPNEDKPRILILDKYGSPPSTNILETTISVIQKEIMESTPKDWGSWMSNRIDYTQGLHIKLDTERGYVSEGDGYHGATYYSRWILFTPKVANLLGFTVFMD